MNVQVHPQLNSKASRKKDFTIDAHVDGPWSHPRPIDGISWVAPVIPQPAGQVSPSTRPIDRLLPGQLAVVWVVDCIALQC